MQLGALRLGEPPSITEVATFGVPTSGVLTAPIGLAGAGMGFRSEDVARVVVNGIDLLATDWTWRSPSRIDIARVPPGVGTGTVTFETAAGLVSAPAQFFYDSAQVVEIRPPYLLAGSKNATVTVCGEALAPDASFVTSMSIGGVSCSTGGGAISIDSFALFRTSAGDRRCIACEGFMAPMVWPEP